MTDPFIVQDSTYLNCFVLVYQSLGRVSVWKVTGNCSLLHQGRNVSLQGADGCFVRPWLLFWMGAPFCV